MNSTRTHLPVTVQMLHSIRSLLPKEIASYINITLWAMYCLAFFGFLRVSEFTIPTEGSYDPFCHLSLSDIAVDNRKNSHLLLQLFLKQSKTDPFKQGVQVYMGTTDSPVCPIRAILSYLGKRSRQPGLFFITKDGKG